METRKKINSLGFLRGLAVLLVCFCHFGYAITLAKPNPLNNLFKFFSIYGKFGVNIFFVISGFIIPLSMEKARYNLKYYFKFLAKRAVRLHPPYLAALFLTLVLVAVANKVKHIPFPENTTSILKSFFYASIPGDNPVFWTLKIEAQYYIFIGLFFVPLKNFQKLTLCLSIPLFMVLSQTAIINYVGLFNFLIFFLIGIVGYLIYDQQGSKILEIVCLISLIAFSFFYYELPATISATATILFILFYNQPINRYLNFTGEISYSVYLIHYPVGIKLINATIKHLDPNYYLILFLGTNIIVFALAYLFWKILENPFANLSNKIKYGIKSEPKSLVTENIR